MANVSIVSVLVSISDTVIYAHQCIVENERNCNIIAQNEEYIAPQETHTLLDTINHRLCTDESIDKSSSYTINIPMETANGDTDVYKLCCKTEGSLTVSILIKYPLATPYAAGIEAELEKEITPILNSIQYQIHNFFTSSKQIPIYILCMRCHLLIQKELTYYQTKRNRCCNKIETVSSQDMNRMQLEMEIYHKETAHWTDKLALELSNYDENNTTSQTTQFHPVSRHWGGGHIIVYSITSPATFEEAKQTYQRICRISDDKDAPPAILLVGNKCDLRLDRQVSTDEAQEWAREWDIPFIETSAKTGMNHMLCAQEMVREIVRKIFQDPRDAIMMFENGAVPEFNMVMQGGGGVGKSALTIRCITGEWMESYDPTIEDSYRAQIMFDGRKVLIDILDTAGQEEFCAMQDSWIRQVGYSRISASYDKTKHAKQKRLIDNIFGDLENMFYLLSDLVYLSMNKGRYFAIKLAKLLLEILFIYPLVVVISVLMVLPSCFFLLFVRMNKIESDTKQVEVRQEIIERETCMQRFNRIINQCLRSLFMVCLLVILPIFITYVIIPNAGSGDNGVDIVVIGLYLCVILLLQIFGTYRGLKSFETKKKETVNAETGHKTEFKLQTFKWNLGSMIAVFLLLLELFQMALFVFHVSENQQQPDLDAMAVIEPQEGQQPVFEIENERLIKINNGLKAFFEKLSYISFDMAASISLADYYMIFSIVFVGALLAFFIFRFIYELRKYAIMKRGDKDIAGSRQFYFYSFVGCIIYGHGTLKNVNKFSAKIISLLSDTLFLGICEKLILLLLCNKSDVDNKYYMMLDPDIKCWSGKHQIYATLSLILIGYYIPMCTMIAPMFDEIPGENEQDGDEEEKKEEEGSKIKQLLSFDNDVDFVRPFISTITVTKCFMLIFAIFIFSGGVIAAIISEFVSCFALMVFTLYWSFANLRLYGLTQNEPGFPFGICMIRVFGFFCGICGCFIQILVYNNIIHSNVDFIVLFIAMVMASIIIGVVFLKYYTKYNKFDDNINQYLAVSFDKNEKQLKLVKNTTP